MANHTRTPLLAEAQKRNWTIMRITGMIAQLKTMKVTSGYGMFWHRETISDLTRLMQSVKDEYEEFRKNHPPIRDKRSRKRL